VLVYGQTDPGAGAQLRLNVPGLHRLRTALDRLVPSMRSTLLTVVGQAGRSYDLEVYVLGEDALERSMPPVARTYDALATLLPHVTALRELALSGESRRCLITETAIGQEPDSMKREVMRSIRETHHGVERLLAGHSENKAEVDRLLALRESNRALEVFGYRISHDLQAPLRGLTMSMEYFLEKHDSLLDDEDRDIARMLRRDSDRMRGMVDGLLRLSRVRTSAEPLVSVSLQEVVVDVLRLLGEDAACIHVLNTPPVVLGDRPQLHSLLLNILGNAIKFADPREPDVRMSFAVAGKLATIQVTDNGVGLDPQRALEAFDVFTQLDHDIAGHGMGLSVCRAITDRHGGTIELRSDGLGTGATVIVTLLLPAIK